MSLSRGCGSEAPDNPRRVPVAGRWEPDELRGSRPVLRAPGVQLPPATHPGLSVVASRDPHPDLAGLRPRPLRVVSSLHSGERGTPGGRPRCPTSRCRREPRWWRTGGDSPPSLKHSLSYAGDTTPHAPDRRRERRRAFSGRCREGRGEPARRCRGCRCWLVAGPVGRRRSDGCPTLERASWRAHGPPVDRRSPALICDCSRC